MTEERGCNAVKVQVPEDELRQGPETARRNVVQLDLSHYFPISVPCPTYIVHTHIIATYSYAPLTAGMACC